MLRFLSRRHKPRREQKAAAAEHRKADPYDRAVKGGGSGSHHGSHVSRRPNKNAIMCSIMLLDGSDLNLEVSVRKNTHISIIILLYTMKKPNFTGSL